MMPLSVPQPKLSRPARLLATAPWRRETPALQLGEFLSQPEKPTPRPWTLPLPRGGAPK